MDFTKSFQRVGVILAAALAFVASLYKIVSLSTAQQLPDNVRGYYDQATLICGAFLVLAVAYGSYRATMAQRRRKLMLATGIFAAGLAFLVGYVAIAENWVRSTDASCGEQLTIVEPSPPLPRAVANRLDMHGSWAVMLCEDSERVRNAIEESNGSRELILVMVMTAMTSAFALSLTLLLWAILLDRDKVAKQPRRRPAPATPAPAPSEPPAA